MSSKVNSLLRRRRASQSSLSISDPEFVGKADLTIVTKNKVKSLEQLQSPGMPNAFPMPGATVDITIPPDNMIIIRDTIKVIKAISDQLDDMLDVDFQKPDMSKMVSADLLEVSKNFDEWLELNKKAVESLKMLHLSGLGLKYLPRSINKLTALDYLDLSKNRFETVSSNITTMTSLTNLDLSANKIKELPSWIGRFKNLKTLNLSNNKLKTLPEGIIGLTNLAQIDLWGNKFKAVPEVLYKMKKERDNDKKLAVCSMSGGQRGPWPVESMEEEEPEKAPDPTTIDGKLVKEIKDRSFCSPSFQKLAIGTIMSVGLLALSFAWTRNLNNIAVLGE